MSQELKFKDRALGALYGMFIADALSMPVHWYYDTKALKRDYGMVTEYLKPHNPHPDSILWRSSYTPPNKKVDILHNQSPFWGKRGIHYHQFLMAGENTLNLKLSRELLLLIKRQKSYSARTWLEHLVTYMITPGNHNDTYIEEYLRYFFTKYGQGHDVMSSGREDENHIGGLSLMLPLILVFGQDRDYALDISLKHMALTHGGYSMYEGGRIVACILLDVLHGKKIKNAIADHCQNKQDNLSCQPFESLIYFADETVVGKHFSSACYINQSVPATLYLAMKYQKDPEKALIANTMCGGDNAGRGAVLGALLGAENGMACWPEKWINGLVHPPQISFLHGTK